MEFLIADTFTDSLSRLTGDEQKAVKTTAFDLQLNPTNPGMQFHKLDRARDDHFWSVRVSADIRLIVHKTESSLLLCYVDHHEAAYRWAARRYLEAHPKTGAAQFVEVRETVRDIIAPVYSGSDRWEPPKHPIFADVSDDDLLNYGVPKDWLSEVRLANEDTILELAEHLPSEAAEALLDLATGTTPQVLPPMTSGIDPFDHPDAQRRFRVMNNIEELERALDYPWDKWTTFLHPTQRHLVERGYNGPTRISGSAGTGKTIVALHRAVYLARNNPDGRVLLATFSDTLANVLRGKLRSLISNEPRLAERLEVHALNSIGLRLFELRSGRPNIPSPQIIQRLLSEASGEVEGQHFSQHFLQSEWEDVVDAWQLESWDAYRDVTRLGRKTRLTEKQRHSLWSVFDRVRSSLKDQELITYSELFTRLSSQIVVSRHTPFDFAVIDEAQDASVAQMRFLAALGSMRPDSLFFTGDLGQRIFLQPFSWRALGIDIRGRARTLRINYRTSHQIRVQADRLLAPELSDVDGNAEERRGTVSVFNGPEPTISVLDTTEAEIEAVALWLADRANEGMMPHELAVFVRSSTELNRACTAVERAGLALTVLDENVESASGHVSIGTMHLAKGLEFRAVVVMACDDEIIPLQQRIEDVSDDADLDEVYNTERHLLYVACTRARERLLVTGVNPASEFLDDLKV